MAGLDLRHGDCLDLLRDIPDASVDCVLTDPPYASGGISLRERQQRTQTKYKLNNVKKVYPEFFGDAKDQRGWLAWAQLWLAQCWRVARDGAPERFTVRSFGAWAHHDAMITASQCVFWQSRAWPGLRQALTDLGNWIGWSVNQRSLRPLDYLLPGQCRALTASQGGRVLATYCYKNRWWLRVAGHVGPRMKKKDALDLVTYLESVCPRA